MQMVTLFKQILINVLGSKQTAGAVRDIKDEIPQLGILITHERRTCDGIVHNMDPIGNDTFMTETLYNESGKIIITNTSKEDGPMAGMPLPFGPSYRMITASPGSISCVSTA